MTALITQNRDLKLTAPRPKLLMIWEKELNSDKHHGLVCRWVIEG
jgi:hypothetical protein